MGVLCTLLLMDQRILNDIKSFQNSGDLMARDRLVEQFLPLIFKAIYKALVNKKNVKAEEYLSVAVEAFIHAISKLDLEKHKLSSSFISNAIRWSVVHQIHRDNDVKNNIARHCQQYFMTKQFLTQELKREPSDEEIRHHLGLTPKLFETIKESVFIQSSMFVRKSLDDPLIDHSEGSLSVKDSIQGHDRSDVIKDIEESSLKMFFEEIFQVLSDKERKVIVLRYFDEKNFFEIGKELGVSHQFCSVLNRKALQKIRLELIKRGISCSSLDEMPV